MHAHTLIWHDAIHVCTGTERQRLSCLSLMAQRWTCGRQDVSTLSCSPPYQAMGLITEAENPFSPEKGEGCMCVYLCVFFRGGGREGGACRYSFMCRYVCDCAGVCIVCDM